MKTKKEINKELQEKAIDIKGKQYSLVSDRVLAFNENYPNGSIRTKIVSDNGEEIIYKAIAIPDMDKPERYFTGHASGVRGGSGSGEDFNADVTSAVENGETSAIGRCLSCMGLGILSGGIASADEMGKAKKMEGKATKAQISFLLKLASEKGAFLSDKLIEELKGSKSRASLWIGKLKNSSKEELQKELDKENEKETGDIDSDDIPF